MPRKKEIYKLSSGDISRGGFEYGYGRFFAKGRVERIDGSRLEALFLPRVTQKGKELLQYHPCFLRGQLQHYGMLIDKKNFTIHGVRLLKTILRAGMCNKVPDHIEALRLQMHAEWMAKVHGQELSHHPTLLMEKYFVDGSGTPDSTKTAELVYFSYKDSRSYAPKRLRQAASQVSGLHHATAYGSTETVCLGWDQAAVVKGAQNHAAKVVQENKAKEGARKAARTLRYEKYLAAARRAKTDPSPVGHYIVDCAELEHRWPYLGRDFTLDIRPTLVANVFEVILDFQGVEGIMVFGSDEAILDLYCAEQEDEYRQKALYGDSEEEDEDDDQGDEDDEQGDEDDEEENEDNEEEDGGYYEEDEDGVKAHEDASAGFKRKATIISAQSSEPPPKKTKEAHAGSPKLLFARVKSRNVGAYSGNPTKEGIVEFSGPDLSSFDADVDMVVGNGVSFTARKVCAKPSGVRDHWGEF